ncbi:MAG: PEGA domain-containing protein, partial [Alloprevotella sp.]
MKAKLLLLLFCLCTVGAMGQGVVTRNKCKTCGKVLSKCVCNKKQKSTSKPKSKAKQTPQPQPAPEAAGYDVTFTCNVSSANLYVDGNANGTASGSHFLKTGQHTIQVTANGYKDYTRVITVNRQNRSFYIDLE